MQIYTRPIARNLLPYSFAASYVSFQSVWLFISAPSFSSYRLEVANMVSETNLPQNGGGHTDHANTSPWISQTNFVDTLSVTTGKIMVAMLCTPKPDTIVQRAYG